MENALERGDFAQVIADADDLPSDHGSDTEFQDLVVQAQHGLSQLSQVALESGDLGRIAQADQDWAGAREHYAAALAITETLAAADPTNADRQRDLSASRHDLMDLYSVIGTHAEAGGDLAAARKHYAAALAFAETLGSKRWALALQPRIANLKGAGRRRTVGRWLGRRKGFYQTLSADNRDGGLPEGWRRPRG